MTSTLCSIAETLLNKTTCTSEVLELCKLCLSSTVSFTSPRISSMFESFLPPHWFQQAKYLSETTRATLNCPVEVVNSIQGIAKGVLKFENDLGIKNSLAYFDRLRYEESDKDSTYYQIIRVVETV